MAQISAPTNESVDMLAVDQQRTPSLSGVNPGWRNWFNSVFTICNALTMSGTTAQRPTVGLWKGRMYFDTSLGANGGKPIWVASYAAGAAVWVDATGAIV